MHFLNWGVIWEWRPYSPKHHTQHMPAPRARVGEDPVSQLEGSFSTCNFVHSPGGRHIPRPHPAGNSPFSLQTRPPPVLLTPALPLKQRCIPTGLAPSKPPLPPMRGPKSWASLASQPLSQNPIRLRGLPPNYILRVASPPSPLLAPCTVPEWQ